MFHTGWKFTNFRKQEGPFLFSQELDRNNTELQAKVKKEIEFVGEKNRELIVSVAFGILKPISFWLENWHFNILILKSLSIKGEVIPKPAGNSNFAIYTCIQAWS